MMSILITGGIIRTLIHSNVF